jgi:hypothetical protein
MLPPAPVVAELDAEAVLEAVLAAVLAAVLVAATDDVVLAPPEPGILSRSTVVASSQPMVSEPTAAAATRTAAITGAFRNMIGSSSCEIWKTW